MLYVLEVLSIYHFSLSYGECTNNELFHARTLTLCVSPEIFVGLYSTWAVLFVDFLPCFFFLFFWCFLDLLKFEKNLDILTSPTTVEHVLGRYFPRLFARISWLIIFNFLIFRPERCWVVGWRRRVAADRLPLCSGPLEKCRTCGTRKRTIPQQVHSDKHGYTRKCFFSDLFLIISPIWLKFVEISQFEMFRRHRKKARGTWEPHHLVSRCEVRKAV